MGPTSRQKATVAPWGPSLTRLPPSQLKQRNLWWHKNPQRHAYHADPATHIQLAAPLREVPHHVFRDQAAGGPTDHRQVELTAMDVAGEGQGNRARGGAVERTGAVREQNLERVRRRRREAKCDIEGGGRG